jgi:hypothetical protein
VDCMCCVSNKGQDSLHPCDSIVHYGSVNEIVGPILHVTLELGSGA